jgi:hypothetical protein
MYVTGSKDATCSKVVTCSKDAICSKAATRRKCFFLETHFSSKMSVGKVSISAADLGQGCQMVCFQTKNPNFGKFWRALDWKMFLHFVAIWNILCSFGIFYEHLVHFDFIWYIFSGFGIMYQ